MPPWRAAYLNSLQGDLDEPQNEPSQGYVPRADDGPLARVGSGAEEKKPAEGDSITLTVENETFKAVVVRDGDTLDVVGSYSVVDNETPKLLDLVVQNGDNAMSVYCLYDIEKNVFRIRFNAATGERPPDFKAQVEGGMTLIFHRKK